MLAVLLVGGLGTRLRPLTARCPKPLVPVVNQPFLLRRLAGLERQGVREVVLAVQYQAAQFRQLLASCPPSGMAVRVVEEPAPLGTAGAARFALAGCLAELREPVLVLNGDQLSDLDLPALLAAHRAAGAQATIAVAAVADTRAYGVVVVQPNGRVRTFQEKPAPGTALASTVNTGAYVLEPAVLRDIPAHGPVMFERHTFPDLLSAGQPVAAFAHTTQWIDIGTPAGYLAASRAVLAGQLAGEEIAGRQLRPGVWAEPGVVIAPDAELHGPIALGRDVVVAAGARLVGPLALGAACQVGPAAQLENAILWQRVIVGAGSVVSAAILADDVVLAPGTSISHNVLT